MHTNGDLELNLTSRGLQSIGYYRQHSHGSAKMTTLTLSSYQTAARKVNLCQIPALKITLRLAGKGS